MKLRMWEPHVALAAARWRLERSEARSSGRRRSTRRARLRRRRRHAQSRSGSEPGEARRVCASETAARLGRRTAGSVASCGRQARRAASEECHEFSQERFCCAQCDPQERRRASICLRPRRGCDGRQPFALRTNLGEGDFGHPSWLQCDRLCVRCNGIWKDTHDDWIVHRARVDPLGCRRHVLLHQTRCPKRLGINLLLPRGL
mmetsp:Transcript_7940/g.49031  ORF Transcript_7940/g.49031 Transcript_7940/m.49031 type:complete len:203 (+) Transcript_7940:1094-1702(+)